MTKLAIAPRASDLGDGIVSHANGLEITADLPFNDWRALMEGLIGTTDRALWSLGDARRYGERYEKEYHDGVKAIDDSSRLVGLGRRVASAFGWETGRRRGQLSFEIHEYVSPLSAEDQDRWLDEAERQGWNRQQLAFSFVEQIPRTPQASLSFKAVGELRELCSRAAELPSTTVTIEVPGEVDAKEWVALVLERAARAQTLALEAA